MYAYMCVCVYDRFIPVANLEHEFDDSVQLRSEELGAVVPQIDECLQQRIILLFLHTLSQHLHTHYTSHTSHTSHTHTHTHNNVIP